MTDAQSALRTDDPSNVNLAAAQAYASLGWHTFPIAPRTKIPATSDGFYSASRDPEMLRRFWEADPARGIAIRTGRSSGVLVIDVDAKNGGGKSLRALIESHEPFPTTVECATGGGGAHYYFAYPDDIEGDIPCSQDHLGPGIDVRCDGGYAIAPMSTHDKTGKRYLWTNRPGATPLAPVPRWVLKILLENPKGHSPSPTETQSSAYTDKVTEGQRHKLLVAAAGRLNKALGPSADEMYASLQGINAARCDPPKEDHEVRKIADYFATKYKDQKGRIEMPSGPILAADLSAITDPNVGRVEYLIQDFLPKNEIVMIGAPWKTGKTLVAYQMLLDALGGHPCFGYFDTPEPLRCAMFQLEMPLPEDLRRLRRLAIANRLPPQQVARWAQDKHLALYSRPGFSLAKPEGIHQFLAAARANDPHLIIIDSVSAAFAPADINDNSLVRDIITNALSPLTTEGRSLVILHHKRKAQIANGRIALDDPKSSFLGAQAFGAGVGKIYGLDRLAAEEGANPETMAPGNEDFRVRLASAGSWTPGGSGSDIVLAIEDVNGGTRVRHLRTPEQLRLGGVDASQRVGIALSRLVTARRRIGKIDAFKIVGKAEEVSESTLKRGLYFARRSGWIRVLDSEDRTGNKKDLVPGGIE